MEELLKTNDPVLISFVEALLDEAGIYYMLLDQHTSIMEGSLGFLPRRLLVASEDLEKARRVLIDAELGHELKPAAGGQG
ncbi:DUF2007 domain-containing protein [Breoghania sp.]|uniref:putative signal transducing protein n=1 Tax=Breoghania sp. TaxID=2065378 RepID=UPI002AA95E52|nr:DUF2007 domain-containing protein [Breoghania sp.]